MGEHAHVLSGKTYFDSTHVHALPCCGVKHDCMHHLLFELHMA